MYNLQSKIFKEIPIYRSALNVNCISGLRSVGIIV